MTLDTHFLRSLSAQSLVALAGAGSAAVLAGALVFQSLGFAPCELCILQRWPHLAAAVLAMLLWALWHKAPALRPLAYAGAALMGLSSGLGLYHSGVERHIFAGPDSCTSGPVGTLSASDLLAQINAAPLVRCDEIVWDIFGITMPNLNAAASLGFAALWLWAALKARRG